MPAERRILIIDTVHPVLPDRLSGYGFKCDIDTGKTYEYYSGIIENYYGVILRSRITIDKAFIDAAKRLRFIGRVGSGLENIDVTYAKTKGVKCFNSPEGNRNAVGEHALGLLLSLLNRLHIADRQVREGRWLREENRGREIKNLSVGIIGYGNTGASFAGKLSGMGCRVLAYDKYKKGFGNSYIEEADYQDIFSEVDVVSLHVPLTDETRYLVNNTFLAQFHKPIVLINTSRGKVLDTGALVCHLKQGSVLGAGLDVIEYEDNSFEFLDNNNMPDAMRYLTSAENVILTPHIAGWTKESNVLLAEVLTDKILAEENFLSSSGE